MLVTLRNQLCLEISMRQHHPQTLTCCFRDIGAVSLVFFLSSLVPRRLVSVLTRTSIVYRTVVVRVPDVALAGSHGHSRSRSTRQSVPIVHFSGTISSAMSSYVNLQPLVAISNEERDGIWKIERAFSCSPVAQCARKRDLRAQGFRLARKVSWHDIRAAAPRRAHNSACLLSSSLGRRWNCRRHNLH